MDKFNQLINELESKITHYKTVNLQVSAGSVGWHIEHSLKTIDQIVMACKASNPAEYKWKFNLKRFMIVDVLNKIPRGKVKAPKLVRPEGEISKESLELNLKNIKANLVAWNELDKNAFFKHPFFDDLNKKATVKFLVLHTNHHFRIINDILKS
ncbi:DUF1569 domain-containing protein [Flavobacterium psychraquaticum]|uniref:DUF1569 domain-containing protein n=1 Tax=Flavobacterium psychraquaticum TaxID=3103958 RepID=UPI002ACDC934|nr:DUF1569 domain-containing protein [Flavobacterium sp. LB-N7T]